MIVALIIHIFSVHCKLLYYLNPEATEKHSFSFLTIDEPTVLAMLFALSYSLATAFNISSTSKKSLVVFFGLLDMIGVLLYYFTSIPLYFGAIYFAIYTGSLIVSSIYLNNPEYLSDKINEMKKRGVTQRDIAVKLKISESKVSRLLNKEA
jgi:hypothetical protein